MRTLTHHYTDPTDLIWLAAAAELGMHVQRSSEVFAAWDGAGTLTLSTPEHFDPDDSLAQLILHEICHALVEGPEKFDVIDWGLDNWTDKDAVREHACIRMQAALLKPHGLRWVLAPTTDYRPYYDALPEEPLLDTPSDPALRPARVGYQRATDGPWASALQRALRATAQLAEAIARCAPADSVWHRFEPQGPGSTAKKK
jgi:hypothetical protein